MVYAAYQGGVGGGLIGAAASILYFLYYYAAEDHFFQYDNDNLRRVVTLCVTSPAMALIVGVMKEMQQQLLIRQRQLEQITRKLEKKNLELIELNQVKSNFVSVVSHELRTPLTVILASAGNLADGALGPISDAQKKWVGKISDHANRLHEMITDILDFSKMESGKMEQHRTLTDVGQLLADSLDALQVLAQRKDQQLSLEAEKGLPRAWVDADQIERVVANLVTNAVKFTPEGGRIRVSARAADQNIEVRVADTGPGIPPDRREAVFDRFAQFEPPASGLHGGIGLGLAICKEIVALHHGSIWVESEPGRGSEFIFRIPIDAQRLRSRHAHPAPPVRLGVAQPQ